MPGNIYCGICDVNLEWEADPKYATKEPTLRFVPADYLRGALSPLFFLLGYSIC